MFLSWHDNVIVVATQCRCHAKTFSRTGHENDIAQPKQVSGLALHLIFHHFSPLKWTTPKIRVLCFVLINSVLLNLLCGWILF